MKEVFGTMLVALLEIQSQGKNEDLPGAKSALDFSKDDGSNLTSIKPELETQQKTRKGPPINK